MTDNYTLYIVIWLAVTVLALLIFKTVPRKMKQLDDRQIKNSLFTLLVFIGVPLVMAAVLGPLVFIIGDKNMAVEYKLVWGALVLVFAIYFLIKQRTPKIPT
ncbi:MAG: hypothetical protein L0Y79_10520 [Chlorobi bacterium]|nr:hypothetical protein [Chlorobiota bacterium]MCI0716567.1 hypothetical protein [Chlorobiota bacterium]